MEPRCLLSVTPIHLGAIYTESDIGSDQSGDNFEITFEGGATDTQLRRLEINGDQNISGFSVGDVFFDIQAGGFGADAAFAFTLNNHAGIDEIRVTVVDGTSQLLLEFEGFDAGEVLHFTIDVDEVEEFDPLIDDLEYTNEGFDPITSGVEFQGSLLTADFAAPDFHDAQVVAEFRNRYDDALQASGLDLPEDDAGGLRDRTAGAFGEVDQQFIASSISGFVYHDRDDDGQRDAGEEGIPNVEVQLQPIDTVQEWSVMSITTGADGSYQFQGIPAGTYRVVEVNQPNEYLDGKDTAGTVDGQTVGQAGDDTIGQIAIRGGDDGVEYNFGELLPGSIRGRVQLSTREGDCFGEDVEHEPVVGATVLLLDADGNVVAETTTDDNGEYAFVGLAPGVYSIVEITPDDLLDGGASPGSLGGVVGDGPDGQNLREIDLGSGENGENYDFCEHVPAQLSGHVYVDDDNDGIREAGEAPIPGTLVTLVDLDGNWIAEQRTDDSGYYLFDRLTAGGYRLIETQPDGFTDGLDAAGTVNGIPVGVAQNPGDQITDIALLFGDIGLDYDFGEFMPVSISGRVLAANESGSCEAGDEGVEPIEGVVVQLYNAANQQIAETLTDAEGNYTFDGLAPGIYRVVELTPSGYVDGGASVGSVDSNANGSLGPDGSITQIELDSGDQGDDYDFCELPLATLEGSVYHDRSQDGVQGDGEEGIANVRIQLFDGDGTLVAETTTDADGHYRFEGLEKAIYYIREIQPDPWWDGLDAAGQIDGQTVGNAENPGDIIRNVDLGWGQHGTEYDFGEILPASISGRVHSDIVLDCLLNEVDGESGLEGVTIELLDDEGNLVETTTTDAQGRYSFPEVAPGRYTVREVRPDGYFPGGEPEIEVDAGSGESIEDVDFCEVPPAILSGFVFQDGDTVYLENGEELPDRIGDIRDGVRTVDDTPIPGVLLELRDGITGLPIDSSVALPGLYPDGPVRTTSDSDGFYSFVGLKHGPYSVFQVQPDGFTDGVDTAGSAGGYVFNPGDSVPQVVLQALLTDPANNAIVRISLAPGSESHENNFSEIDTERRGLPPVVPPPPTTPFPPAAGPPLIPGLYLGEPGPLKAWQYKELRDASNGEKQQTWHLSIVDAGNPRGAAPLQSLVQPVQDLLVQDGRGILDRGHWNLPNEYGSRRSRGSEVIIGLGGATPLSGDFNGDGVHEVALYSNGNWFIDINGNGQWDSKDLWAKLGTEKDIPIVGDWNGDGKDDIGIFGPQWHDDNDALRREPGLPDLENRVVHRAADHSIIPKNIPPGQKDAPARRRILQRPVDSHFRADLIDHVFSFGLKDENPVAGDWNGDGIASIGVFHDGKWRLDTNGDGVWNDLDQQVEFGQHGDVPVVGDWNGDGVDDLGVFRDGVFIVDTNDNRRIDDEDPRIRRGEPDDTPISGDWDGDGRDEVGTYRETAQSDSTHVAKKAS